MKPYRECLQTLWRQTPQPEVTYIPVNRAELLSRIETYDGSAKERTLLWMRKSPNLQWSAVRDAYTGHSIHVVSDRVGRDLERDLSLGLRIMNWMAPGRYSSHSSHSSPITWYWWDQPWNRTLPPKTLPTQEHVNGGWTVPGIRSVHVYRREEAHKVLIHELVHALGLDVPQSAMDSVRIQIESSFTHPRSLWPHLGEAFTELYAEFAWSAIQNKKWSEQVECSRGQAITVWSRIRDSSVSEDTSVFAYYILKWVLMEHIDTVLLAPTASVTFWYKWWMEAKPVLDALVDSGSGVGVGRGSVSMGMTCQTV